MAGNAPRLIRSLLIALVMGLLCLIGYELWSLNRPTAAGPLPNPNGYDSFVKATQQLSGEPRDYRDMNVEELRALVATNAGVLGLVRLGLTQRCRVPIVLSTADLSAHIGALADWKRLAFLLAARGELAKREGRTNEAVACCLDTMRFGRECCRGGLMVDRLVGVAIESIGSASLLRLTSGLDAATAREAAKAIEQMDRNCEPLDDTLRTEREWSRRNFSFIERLWSGIPIPAWNRGRAARQSFRRKIYGVQLQTRQAMIDLAVRAFELDRNRYPAGLENLVPEYPAGAPVDPGTGSNMTYRPAGAHR